MSPSHVVSQGLAEELKKAGWRKSEKNGSLYWTPSGDLVAKTTLGWTTFGCEGPRGEPNWDEYPDGEEYVYAPLASELMERMPYKDDYWFQVTRRSSGLWKVDLYSKRGGWVWSFLEMELPDALAKLALHLIKEGKITF